MTTNIARVNKITRTPSVTELEDTINTIPRSALPFSQKPDIIEVAYNDPRLAQSHVNEMRPEDIFFSSIRLNIDEGVSSKLVMTWNDSEIDAGVIPQED